MAETLAHGDGEADAPLDAAAIRSRLERLALLRRGDGEEEADSAGMEAEDALRALISEYEVLDALVPSDAMLEGDGFDAFMEWLRKEISLVEEENLKLTVEIGSAAETALNVSVQLDADVAALESSLKKIDSEGLKYLEESHVAELSVSTNSCGDQTNFDKDYKYEVLELDHQLEKNENDLRLLEDQIRAEAMWEVESMLSEAKVLDYKDSCFRVFLKAPVLTSDCLQYGHKLDCSVNSFASDHELLIEVDEESKEPKKVQIFPDDICIDILFDKVKASRHSFEYFDKDETVVAHLAGGIDAFIKISAYWPLSSYGLKLLSIQNSGSQSTNITLTLLCKTKELANKLELQTRRHLVKFVDAVEDVLLREMQSQLRSSIKS
uniref:Uncharacterized protein n=1 Tax=Leersia perrieri TaxID=77586 RepID=A0A0D9W426_9ORYZ